MAIQWTAPSRGAALSTASAVMGLIATRNEFIGWGPRVAAWWDTAQSNPFEAILLTVAGALIGYAYWRPIIRLFGFKENPGRLWADDEALGAQVLEWARKRVTTTDNTVGNRTTSGGKVAFSFVMSPAERPVNLMKLPGNDGLQFIGRIVPTGDHAATVRGMDEPDYRAMVDDITLEIVSRVAPDVLTAERVIPERGAAQDPDGDEVPAGVFIASLVPIATLTEELFIESVNDTRRAMLIAQALIRKHVRLEDARRGRATSTQDISPTLSIVANSSIATSSNADTEEPQPKAGP